MLQVGLVYQQRGQVISISRNNSKVPRSDGPDACVKQRVVGDGPLRNTLETSYNSNNIIWWGYEADQQRRAALLQAAEVFLLPSLVEGLSLALLEAMASGCACVATDAGADGEVLAGGAGIVISTQGVTTQLRTLLAAAAFQASISQKRQNCGLPRWRGGLHAAQFIGVL